MLLPYMQNWDPIPRKPHTQTKVFFKNIWKDEGSLKHDFQIYGEDSEKTEVQRWHDWDS